MITIPDYFNSKLGNPEVTDGMTDNAHLLLERVNDLLDKAKLDGIYNDWIDPDTGTQVSGSKGGAGDGGFRLSNSTTGAPGSQHRKARAVDVYDPDNVLDDWIDDIKLTRFGLYREASDSTPGWAHLQSVPPGSGRRTYNP